MVRVFRYKNVSSNLVKKGINIVGDVIDPEGKFLSMDDIMRKFDININCKNFIVI